MIFLIYSLKNKDKRELELKNAAWFLYYIIGIIVVSYLGDQGSGIKLITGITPIIILFAFSILIVIIAVKSRISPEESALRISLALSKRNKK